MSRKASDSLFAQARTSRGTPGSADEAAPGPRSLAGHLSPGRYAREVQGFPGGTAASRSASPSTWKPPAWSRAGPKSWAWRFAGSRARPGTWPSAVRRASRCWTRPDPGRAAAVLEDAAGGQDQPEHQVRPAGVAAARRAASPAWPATPWSPITSCTPASAAITWKTSQTATWTIRSSPSRT